MNITIIGAGNGGRAMAGHFAWLGHRVTLYGRSLESIPAITQTKTISLSGKINGTAVLHEVTDDISEAMSEAELVMVVTTADAHKDVAAKIAPYIRDDQIIILNPGRTLGALEFSNELQKHATNKRVFIAEAQSLIYACRAEDDNNVNIIGIKNKVLLAAYPASDTSYVLEKINQVYDCFVGVSNILSTSLENIGMLLHPSITILNAARIEKGERFYFYADMTPSVAAFISKIDRERIEVGRAFGVQLNTLSDWVSLAYEGIEGQNFYEKVLNNPAYGEIIAPTTLKNRYLLEDVPTGILPLVELARLSKVPTPLLESVLHISEVLVDQDFSINGRTLKNLGIDNLTVSELIQRFE